MKVWLPRILFSANSFAAAMLALFLALGMGLANPFWAAMTVYIVSQPQTGSVRSKALYRLLGTLVGGCAAVLLVPLLYNAPELLSLALAGWVGLCLGISLLDRTPRSYIFMLSGYTAALIAFPGVDHPAAIFDTALVRVEEVFLGIGCATLMHSVILPQGVGRALDLRIGGFMEDAARLTLDALSGDAAHRAADAHRLAADISELYILSTHLPFDTSHFHDRSHEVARLAERMAFLLPLANAVGDRLAALSALGHSLPEQTRALLHDVARWVERGGNAMLDDAADFAERARALAPDVTSLRIPRFDALTLASLHARLAELVETYRDCAALSRQIRTGEPLPEALEPLIASARHHALHRDFAMAAWSGATATLAILVVCAFWILTGWPDGGTAAMLVSIFMCLFAAMDDPARGIDSFALWWTISVPLTALYVFAIMPMLNSFAMLALALAPTLLVLGVLLAMPRHTPRMAPLLIGFVGALGIKETFTPDFAQFANMTTASLLGIGAASLVTRLVRSVGVDFSARRIVRLANGDVVRAITARKPLPPAQWASRMVDRVGLLGSRVAARGDPEDLVVRLLQTMRVGLNLLSLRAISGESRAVARLLGAMTDHFRGPGLPDETLLAHIDAAIAETTGDRGSGGPNGAAASGREAMLALIGLRRTLFPASLHIGAAR